MSFFLVLFSIHFLATLSYNKRLTLVGYEMFDKKFIRYILFKAVFTTVFYI
jgi:hypothetical protein